MHTEGKVVPLVAAADRGARVPSLSLPIVLLQVRDKAVLQLRQGLQALFDNADDRLFEMADRTGERVDQNLYFEAMRDLRLKRKSIEREFLDAFYDAFARIGQAERVPYLAITESLRNAAQPERAAAIEGMLARVLSRDGFALDQLGLRFQALLEMPLELRRNPLGPECLCGFFLDAGRSLGVGPQVKLILLKLFERYVLRDLDLLYGEANQLLAAAGILPELMPAPRRRAEDRPLTHLHSADCHAQADPADGDSTGQDFFASLQPLLAPARGRFAPRLQSVATAEPINTADLLRLLSHLQHYVPGVADADDFNLSQQLEQLLLRVGVRSGNRRRIGNYDEDVINLVGLLFDFIQTDDNLPSNLRELLVRLHIPLLKVALLDRGLFSRANHPARRLLDEIAAAALGWEADEQVPRGGPQQRVERIVQRLLNDYAEDPQLFAELLEDFLAFNQDERRRNELLEQRTRDAEEGRARTVQARQRVQQELNLRLHGRMLPQTLVQMLVQSWSQVLLLAWLKHGEASPAWRQGLATMDSLLASISAHRSAEACAQLLEQVPGLLKALRDGLASVAQDSTAAREFFAELEQLHLRACGGVSQLDQGALISEVLVADEIVLAVADETTCDAPFDDSSEYARQVRQLRVGSWLEVLEEAGPLRCKLVVRIDSCDRLVFTSRTGIKVREWSRGGLALALANGEVRVLDDGPLFERALDAALQQLRGSLTHSH